LGAIVLLLRDRAPLLLRAGCAIERGESAEKN
jgi:hypothetical protein